MRRNINTEFIDIATRARHAKRVAKGLPLEAPPYSPQTGEMHHSPVFNWAMVDEARGLYAELDSDGKRKYTIGGLASRYGASYNAMWNVLNNKTWIFRLKEGE